MCRRLAAVAALAACLLPAVAGGQIYGGGTSSGSGSSSSLTLASPTPLLPLGKSGGVIQVSGDSIPAGSGGAMHSITAALLPIITSRFRGAGLTPPTFTNNAIGGQTLHDIWITHISDQVLAAADGNDVIIDGGINDVLGLAGNDGAGPFTNAQSLAILQTGLATFAASRPNSRLFYLGCVWGGAEAWTKGSNGLPIGNNTNDAKIQVMNAGIAGLIAQYPNQMRFIDLYSGMYQVSMARNQAQTTTGILTQDGVHPGHLGVKAAKDIILANVFLPEGRLPTISLPLSRSDFALPDWFQEMNDLIQTYKAGGSGAYVPINWTYNRAVKVDFSQSTLGSDGNLEGGSRKFTGTTPILATSTIYQGNPKTGNQVCEFRMAFPALASGMVGLYGLTNSSGSEALLFGVDNSASTTKFVIRETHSSSSTPTPTSLNADTAEHDVVYLHNPDADSSHNNIYDVVIDGVQVSHLNPSANFPTSALAIGSGAQSTSPAGFANVLRAQCRFVE